MANPYLVVDVALKENGIRCLRIDQGSANGGAINRFRKDPDILVLLLHGYVLRDIAGLFFLNMLLFFLAENEKMQD